MKTGNGAAEGVKSSQGEKWKTATPISANSICQAGVLPLSSVASLFSRPHRQAYRSPPFVLPREQCLAMGPGF